MAEPADSRANALLDWYHRHRRPLPWRETSDPWAILVSEVMLQQTQAVRVVPHYRAFLARYPTPAALAAASPADVLRAWSGLGYNRRALRLRETAHRIAAEGWPATPAGLRALPGVGPYTAAAVSCFAFGAQLPTPDTNHRRVLSRWESRTLSGSDLEAVATDHLPAGRAQDWNQALMDLGALLCRPRQPVCDRCPAAAWCPGPLPVSPARTPSPFAGSRRQARGAVLRALLATPEATVPELVARTGLRPERVTGAVETLADDGMITKGAGRVRLAG